MTEINNLPTNVSDGQTGHLNSHQVIHAALKDHEGKVENALSTSSLATNDANNAIDRVAALEEREGLSPESPVDGQTANLILQPETQTGKTLRSGFAQRNLVINPGDIAGEYISLTDQTGSSRSTIRLTDTADHKGSVLNIYHHGTTGGQHYGLNIANMVDASSAIAIHQYSWKAPAIQIDNTDVGSAIYLKNTFNNTMNPGGEGRGSFLQFLPFGETSTMVFNDDLTWYNRTSKDMSIHATTSTEYAFGVRGDSDKTGLQVTKNGTGVGAVIRVINRGTGVSLSLNNETSETFRVFKNGEVELLTPAAGVVMQDSAGKRYKVYMKNDGTLTSLAL